MLRAQHPSPWHASRNSACNNRLGESSVEDFVRDRFGEPVVPFDVMHLQGLIGCKHNDTAERLIVRSAHWVQGGHVNSYFKKSGGLGGYRPVEAGPRGASREMARPAAALMVSELEKNVRDGNRQGMQHAVGLMLTPGPAGQLIITGKRRQERAERGIETSLTFT